MKRPLCLFPILPLDMDHAEPRVRTRACRIELDRCLEVCDCFVVPPGKVENLAVARANDLETGSSSTARPIIAMASSLRPRKVSR